MSDSEDATTSRRTRTRPAMPQEMDYAAKPVTTRRRSLRVDPFSVEPLSRPRRRSVTTQEVIPPSRTRKRAVQAEEAELNEAPPTSAKGKRTRQDDGVDAGKPKRTTKRSATDRSKAAKADRPTAERTTKGAGATAGEDRDVEVPKDDGSQGTKRRTRTRSQAPLALPETKAVKALPEPKAALALDEPRASQEPQTSQSGGDEEAQTPASIRRTRERRRSTTKGARVGDVDQLGDTTLGTEGPTTGADQDEDGRDAVRRQSTLRRSSRVKTTSVVDMVDSDGGYEDEDDGDGKRKRRTRRRKRKIATGEATRESSTKGSKSSRRSAQGQVPAEVRHAIEAAPPRKMLVTRKDKTTQIAVLEDRTLVEHYVTQSHEQSFVGNIYKGRVQNVLPGMEAAFVDIGKGRNGVLYAGEVLYDEADLDGEPVRIESQLKPGQTVIVQVTKDPMGTKGARLTQQLSLAGRFCVLSPFDTMLGISRKLPEAERERLRKILKGVRPEGYGLIVRTAAEGCSADQLIADVQRLVARWERVQEKIEKAKALEMVYAEPDLVLRVIRDVFGSEHTELIVDDEQLAERIRDYLGETSPEDMAKVHLFTQEGADGQPRNLFADWQISAQVRRALETKVWLKSGGYLIIEKTEAMWVIDVNTGRFVGKDNLEETILKNNIEAAVEIARQLRLRDMGGIIVIDFVDMIVPAHRDEVLKRFKAELARDKTKTRVMDISKLGLVQMTRKNVSKGLMEVFTEPTDDVIPGRRIIKKLLDD